MASSGSIESTGEDGPSTTTSASVTISRTGSDTDHDVVTIVAVDRSMGLRVDEVLRDVHGTASVRPLDDHVQLGSVVADRVQAERQRSSGRHRGGRVTEGVAGLQELGADELPGDVRVAGSHPGRGEADCGQLVRDRERRPCAALEGQERIDIGAHLEPVAPQIARHGHDDVEAVVDRKQARKGVGEVGALTTGEQDHAHLAMVSAHPPAAMGGRHADVWVNFGILLDI